jgi:hypothetical protein
MSRSCSTLEARWAWLYNTVREYKKRAQALERETGGCEWYCETSCLSFPSFVDIGYTGRCDSWLMIIWIVMKWGELHGSLSGKLCFCLLLLLAVAWLAVAWYLSWPQGWLLSLFLSNSYVSTTMTDRRIICSSVHSASAYGITSGTISFCIVVWTMSRAMISPWANLSIHVVLADWFILYGYLAIWMEGWYDRRLLHRPTFALLSLLLFLYYIFPVH